MKQIQKPSVFKTRRFKSGGYAVLVSVIVVAVVVCGLQPHLQHLVFCWPVFAF